MTRKLKAFSVIEFLVVSALTLLLFYATAITLGSNGKVQYNNLIKDEASTLTYQVLDRARLAHCAELEAATSTNSSFKPENCATAFKEFEVSGKVKINTLDNGASQHALFWAQTAQGAAPSVNPEEQIYYVSLDYAMIEKNSSLKPGENATCKLEDSNARPALARYTVRIYLLESTVLQSDKIDPNTILSQDPAAIFKEVQITETTEPLPNKFLLADTAMGFEGGKESLSTLRLRDSDNKEVIFGGGAWAGTSCSWFFIEDALKVDSSKNPVTPDAESRRNA